MKSKDDQKNFALRSANDSEGEGEGPCDTGAEALREGALGTIALGDLGYKNLCP